VQSLLKNHTWPGNVRELRKVIERVAVLNSETTITPQHHFMADGDGIIIVDEAIMGALVQKEMA
jgi:DNA-binding NtrC family response regulator